jgi:hypothetical protein
MDMGRWWMAFVVVALACGDAGDDPQGSAGSTAAESTASGDDDAGTSASSTSSTTGGGTSTDGGASTDGGDASGGDTAGSTSGGSEATATTDAGDACADAGGTCVCAGTCAGPTDPSLDAACPQPGDEAGSCSMVCCIDPGVGETEEPPAEPCGCYAQHSKETCLAGGGECIWYSDSEHCTYSLCGDLTQPECGGAKLCTWIDGACYPPGECGA